MRAIKYIISGGLLAVASLILVFSGPRAQSSQQENHCFTCHTNARKLIQITREITKADKDKPGGSVETEGEG